MNTRKALILLVGYFALAGIAAHFMAVALYFKHPEVVHKLTTKITQPFQKLIENTAAQESKNTPTLSLVEEIEQILPAWKSLPAVISAPGRIAIGGKFYTSLKEASLSLKDGDTLQIGEGIYTEPLIIKANDVTVVGEGAVVIEKTSAEGKAAIITKGNNTHIKNIECRNIAVPHGNGACIRHQGKHLKLTHVYFHSSQQGVLTGKNPGFVVVKDSRFERLGNKGQSHGIYMGGGELDISNSAFIAAKNQGHAIKSRASTTRVHRTLVSSLSSNDSRLIDIPNGGKLIVSDSTLHQGPKSVNQDMIGYGLEGSKHAENEIIIYGNLIVLERGGPNVLLHTKDPALKAEIDNNIIITSEDLGEIEKSNLVFETRADAGLKPYPYLPPMKQNR